VKETFDLSLPVVGEASLKIKLARGLAPDGGASNKGICLSLRVSPRAANRAATSARHGRRTGSRRSPHQRLAPINGGSTQRSPSGGDRIEPEGKREMMITTPQGAAIDPDNVARVKHVYGYDSKRAVRVYFYDFDGACEYLDPDGELYEAFKKAGISASQPAVRTDAASV
jgi:hypothetical protein